jgi:hypothetical protein
MPQEHHTAVHQRVGRHGQRRANGTCI